jgi:hypothetical protein
MLTITTPADSYDLTTLQAVKAELGVTDTADDEKLAGYISQASDVVAKFCNRVFAQETMSESFRLERQRDLLILSRYPISEVASVVENDMALTPIDYEFDGENGTLQRLRSDVAVCWPRGKITITYTAGYALPSDLPLGIERATILLVKQFASNSDRDLMTKRETTEGVRTTEYFYGGDTGLPPEVEGLLIPHRKPFIG